MAISRFNGSCESCGRIYSLESSSGGCCSQCTANRKLQMDCVPNGKCRKCKEPFYSPNLIEICPFCSVKKYNQLNRPERVYDNLKPTKKRGNGISLQELDRRAEYKRVMDDKGWDHYLRGNKWDKI